MLTTDGIATAEGLTTEQAADVNRYLNARPRYGGHVPREGRPVQPRDTAACWDMAYVVGAPHLFELALRSIPLATDYLGTEPRLYSMNVFETFPSAERMNPDIQEYHRDKDDVKFLALFVYLTDVLTQDAGAHLFKKGTHLGEADGPVVTVIGPAGTAFVEDGRGLHFGLRPAEQPRRIAWIRWGVSDPTASYLWDRMRPVPRRVLGDRYPTDPTVQRLVHLVVS